MKKILLFAAAIYAYTANAQSSTELKATATPTVDEQAKAMAYGKPVNEKAAISIAEFNKKAGEKEMNDLTVSATITEVCQAEGCWIRVSRENDEGTTMLVKFKDHSFTIPKDLAGKKVIFTGRAYPSKVSVEMQKHYAEDAGKSKEEIEKITEPKEELAFEAIGVIIK